MPLLGDGWTRFRPQESPYRWLRTEPGQVLGVSAARRLAASFPAGSFVRTDASGRTGRKSYRNFSRQLAGPGAAADTRLPPLWQELVADLLADGYRRQVARLLDQPIAPGLEVRLVRHGEGDWLGPHTDGDDKLFSHIFYFTPGWRAEWGGCLQILGSPDPDDVVDQVVPRLGASALLARAGNSWHQVSAVAARPVPQRTSLLVHGLR